MTVVHRREERLVGERENVRQIFERSLWREQEDALVGIGSINVCLVILVLIHLSFLDPHQFGAFILSYYLLFHQDNKNMHVS
jgi:hypothetical protein